MVTAVTVATVATVVGTVAMMTMHTTEDLQGAHHIEAAETILQGVHHMEVVVIILQGDHHMEAVESILHQGVRLMVEDQGGRCLDHILLTTLLKGTMLMVPESRYRRIFHHCLSTIVYRKGPLVVFVSCYS